MRADSKKVDELIAALDQPSKEIVKYLRELFLSADSEISEQVKWNSPSFFYTGEMAAFDAKEYKRDLAVVNLHRGKILIVFPTGSKIEKSTGLEGKNYPDGRKIVEIKDQQDAESKSDALRKGIASWLAQIEN